MMDFNILTKSFITVNISMVKKMVDGILNMKDHKCNIFCIKRRQWWWII